MNKITSFFQNHKGVEHSPRWAIIAYIIYLIVFNGIWIINGIDYSRIGESADTLFKWYVAPLLGGAITLAIITTLYGWWRPALFDKKSLKTTIYGAALIMAIVAVVTLATNNYSSVTTEMVLLAIFGSFLVGFNEELLTRGLLLTGFRARYSEKKVWLYSTLLFALLHLPNAFYGLGVAAILQVVVVFFYGSALYILRRYTGAIFLSMALHGMWDLSGFLGESTLQLAGLTLLPIIIIVVWDLKKLFKKNDTGPTKVKQVAVSK